MALTHYTGQDPLAALRGSLPKPRWHTLVLLVVAIGIARCCIAWQLAVAVLLPIRVESCYQRVKRLLAAASGVDFAALQQAWIIWAIGHFAQPGQRLNILLDWTLHTDRCRSLWAQLDIGCGRGLPLAFWLADNQFGGKGKQRVFEDQALRQLEGWLPQGWPVLLIADRGFGGRNRIAFVAELGWSFLFRITGDGRVGLVRWVRGRRGWRRRVYWQRVDADPPSPGQRWFKEKVRYGRHHSIEVNLAAVCLSVPGKADAVWYLATNLPASEDVVALYALRMQIEQSFRDYKSGMGLEREYTRRPGQRLRWLLLAVMVAAGRALWQGCPLPGQEARAKAEPAVDATTTATTQASPTETKTAARRYRVVSDFRRGWHEGLNELVEGDSEVRQAILDARDKARRMQQRPQVIKRRKPLPTKNRHRTRPAA